MKRNYWLDLFTGITWNELLEAGGNISGFRESRWKSVQQIKEGDYLLCYLTGLSRWVGLLEVTGPAFKDDNKIWSDESFPCRVPVKTLIVLKPENAIPVKDLKDSLSYFKNEESPNAWTGHFRGSPAKENQNDAEIVINALKDGKDNPIDRPVDKNKLLRKPRVYSAKGGEVTIPDKVEDNNEEVIIDNEVNEDNEDNVYKVTHEEIQYILIKLGHDLGMDIWVAKNDRNRCYIGKSFSDFPRLIDKIPTQFDLATNRTIELIDVLWLKGNTIAAAFEVEHTTSIYSGLLRMSDLITMQPNININLYIVAPDSRRNKVFEEINRPTFARLKPPLNEYCQFISYSVLKESVEKLYGAGFIKYTNPKFIDDIAETCVIEE